jgi:hypothetical protein
MAFNERWVGAAIGGVAGAVLGSSIGIAGFGGAMAGTLPVAAIGAYLGHRVAPYLSQKFRRPQAGNNHTGDLANAPGEVPASHADVEDMEARNQVLMREPIKPAGALTRQRRPWGWLRLTIFALGSIFIALAVAVIPGMIHPYFGLAVFLLVLFPFFRFAHTRMRDHWNGPPDG